MAYPKRSLPNTQHSVFYAYSITANNVQIGSFQKFSASFTRTAERIREIFFHHGARTNDIVWAGTDIQVQVDRVEMYNKAMLEAFGYPIFTIEDLDQTVHIHEYMRIPRNPGSPTEPPEENTGARLITYMDCVATSANRDVSVDTARIVESMTFECRTVVGRYLG